MTKLETLISNTAFKVLTDKLLDAEDNENLKIDLLYFTYAWHGLFSVLCIQYYFLYLHLMLRTSADSHSNTNNQIVKTEE